MDRKNRGERMSIQSRVRDFHTKAAGFHSTMARAHSDMAKADGMSEGDSDFHHTAADAHTVMGEYHLQCCKSVDSDFEKAFGSAGDRMMPMPEGLSVITPTAPGVTAVPRAGQRNIAAPQVDEAFRKLVMIDEDEENQ
jgi:hypothetical protein